MKIVLRQHDYDSDWNSDWYRILRAEHDGQVWWEPVGPNASRFMMSERLSPEACIEGEGAQMLALARTIKLRGKARFTRCAVRCTSEGVYFSSPRNSEHETLISFEDADALADQILREIGEQA